MELGAVQMILIAQVLMEHGKELIIKAIQYITAVELTFPTHGK